MNAPEHRAITFHCGDDELVGILTIPAGAASSVKSGVITLPAGGPQYRVGMGRQLLQMANRFAENGTAVLRFDYRGVGDSDGVFEDFHTVEPDLRAAIVAFREHLPSLQEITLYGGCNAASAIMMYAHGLPCVNAIMVSNPYLGSGAPSAHARRMHFIERVQQREFWQKLFSGQYDLREYWRALLAVAKRKLRPETGKPAEQEAAKGGAPRKAQIPVLELMLHGMQQFSGESLIFLSGRSIQSKEFQALVKHNRGWKQMMKGRRVEQLFLPDADQAFSTTEQRSRMIDNALKWFTARAH
ncbi:hydrolase 1, exosortase A system-associated [Pseudomaricurvus sp. HS19]|uniref:hydrolase 1, exosortase A system-associated n=1 Tax=Pseudomaricurvus sp. HS19 TaxID=2692626 RepID=UPI00136D5C57|nr:hydrolase 1, exosortase A system-associated [Pseudomaricurvus sp. HS19]MYM62048.1 hydrolase 1, exosortase A system-associated [Pseudomaricurvus sp. HS19]